MTNSPILVPPPVQGGRGEPARLALDSITLDSRLQSRELKSAVVKDYFGVLRRGEGLPPVRVVRDLNGDYYLVDGHHTVAATQKRLGIEDITVEIVDGTFEDALWLSWGAYRNHGLRRTQKDKGRTILAAVQHPRWSRESDRAIAQHIGCDHKTVGAMRRESAAGEFPTEQTAPGSRPPAGPFKRTILQACRLLAKIEPEQSRQFNPAELATVRAGYEPLHRLLFSASTLGPRKPRAGSTQSEVFKNAASVSRTKSKPHIQ
jgi:hypothetical protein